LDDCGLKDLGFSKILKGIIKQESLEILSYSNDEIGHQSLDQLEEISRIE
jgi:hypothetical protein